MNIKQATKADVAQISTLSEKFFAYNALEQPHFSPCKGGLKLP